ncbi:MAG: helix-turn-helix transcriptional regulator [Alphaproteobacteria bacterium]
MTTRHFNQIDLSRRWNVSPRTLERWRWLGQGPAYLKIGNHVVYRLEDVLAYEEQQVRKTETAPLPTMVFTDHPGAR